MIRIASAVFTSLIDGEIAWQNIVHGWKKLNLSHYMKKRTAQYSLETLSKKQEDSEDKNASEFLNIYRQLKKDITILKHSQEITSEVSHRFLGMFGSKEHKAFIDKKKEIRGISKNTTTYGRLFFSLSHVNSRTGSNRLSF